MSVHWTKTAQDHLVGIYGFIAQNSPEYAQHMVDAYSGGGRTPIPI